MLRWVNETVLLAAVQFLRRVWLFGTSWTAAGQTFLSFTVSLSLLKFMSTELMMISNHFILCRSTSCSQFFPASWSFPMSHLFTSGGQSIGASASASVLPMNIQSWFSLGLVKLLAAKRTLKSLHHNLKAKILQCSAFFMVQHICTWLLEKP